VDDAVALLEAMALVVACVCALSGLLVAANVANAAVGAASIRFMSAVISFLVVRCTSDLTTSTSAMEPKAANS
jgi:hypothetical protein